MAAEIEAKIYDAIGVDKDLVVPIERDADDVIADVPGVDEPLEQAAA